MKSTVPVMLSIAALAGVGVAAAATVYAGGTAEPAVSSPTSQPATAMDDMPEAMDTDAPVTDRDAAHAHVHSRDYAAVWEAATAEEQAGATALVADVKAGTARYADSDVAIADGYGPNPSGGPDASHWPSGAAARDQRILDRSRPESLTYWTAPDGRKVLVGAVFKAFPWQDAPTPGGDLTMWHVHESPATKCYPAEDDTCEGTKMLHVFFFDGVVDPFTENWAAAAGGRDAFLRAVRAMA